MSQRISAQILAYPVTRDRLPILVDLQLRNPASMYCWQLSTPYLAEDTQEWYQRKVRRSEHEGNMLIIYLLNT